MTKITKNRFKGVKEQAQDELELNKKIKPHLKKFVIAQMNERAKEVATERAQRNKQFDAMTELRQRGLQLSEVAFRQLRLWREMPPAFEARWIQLGTATPELERDMNLDMAGFGLYLANEFIIYSKHKNDKKGYPNPMQEVNLKFFWQKFIVDCRLLIAADLRRKAKGNKPLIISD